MGESGVDGDRLDGFDGEASPPAAAARLATELPDLGEGVRLLAAPRFTGVFLGDTGGLLLGETAGGRRPDDPLEDRVPDGDRAGPLPRAGSASAD